MKTVDRDIKNLTYLQHMQRLVDVPFQYTPATKHKSAVTVATAVLWILRPTLSTTVRIQTTPL